MEERYQAEGSDGYVSKRVSWGSYILKGYSKFEEILYIASVIVVVLLMFFVTAEVIGRYFFNKPIPGHVETVEVFLVALVFAGMAYTEQKNVHVRLEMLPEKLKGRALNGLEAFILVISFIPMVIIAIFATQYAFSLKALNKTTWIIGIPLWPFALSIGIGCGMVSIRMIISFVQRLTASLSKRRA